MVSIARGLRLVVKLISLSVCFFFIIGNQFHQVGGDIVILTHKSNPTLHTFQCIATPGAAVKFNTKYEKVYQLWKTYMTVEKMSVSRGY